MNNDKQTYELINRTNGEAKKMNFKYNNYLFDKLCVLGMFVICFGIPILLFISIFLKWQGNEIALGVWSRVLTMIIFFIHFIASMFAAGRLSAIITENDGEAIFNNDELELILKKQNIQIRYSEVVRIEFEKIVGGDWSFLPIGKMKILLANNRKIKIFSSRREAQKLKKEYGLMWKYKFNEDGSATVPNVLLWKVCVEISKRTGHTIYVEKIIEQSSD